MGVAVHRAAIRLNGFSVLSPDQIKGTVVSAVLKLLCKKKLLTTSGECGTSKSDVRRTNMSACVAKCSHSRIIHFFLLLHADAA